MRLISTIIGTLFILWCSPGNAQNTDSLKNLIVNNIGNDSIPYWEEQIGNSYFNSDFDSARYHYFKALSEYDDHEHGLYKASLLKRIAISFAYQGKQDSAIHFMTESLDYYKKNNDSLQIAFSHNNLGLMYADISNYTSSMEHLLKAYQFKNSLLEKHPPEKLDIPGTELNIGITYHYIEDFENAKRYYNMAMESYTSQQDSFGMLNSALQLANLYLDLKQYSRADSIYNKLLQEPLISSKPFVHTKLLNNYATLLFKTEKYLEAKTVLNEVYQLNLHSGNIRSAVKNLNNLAEISYLEKDYDKALEYGKESLRLCQENDLIYSEEIVLKVLSETYEEKGQFSKALELQKRKELLADSLYNSEKNELLTEMETRYQSAQKEKEIAVKNLEIERVKTTRLWFILLSALLIIFSAIFFLLYRDRKKKNLLLQQTIRTKDKLISIIAHDLKNPAIAQKMAIHNLLQYIDHLKKEDIQPQLQALYQSSESQVTLLLNLLNWAHAQSGHIEYNPSYFRFIEVVQKNVELFQTTAHNKKLTLEVSGDPEWTVFADKTSINTVLRNLVSNAIKFSHQGNQIKIQSTILDDNTLKCSVIDQGIGISADKLSNLFTVEKRELGTGTEGEQGSGLGLILCREMLEKNGGTLNIYSEENKGTTTSFTLPLNPVENP